MTTHRAFQSHDVAELVSGLHFAALQRLVQLLSPLEVASEHLSGQKYPTVHLVLPTKEQLQRHLKPASSGDLDTKRLKLRLKRNSPLTTATWRLPCCAPPPPHWHLSNFAYVTDAQRVAQGG